MTDELIQTRTIAISAIYTVASQIKDIAWNGRQTDNELSEQLAPILRQEQETNNALELYDGIKNIRVGTQAFLDSMSANGRADREINRYVYSLIYLAKKLNENENMLSYITRELDHIRDLTGFGRLPGDDDNFYALNDEHVVRQLANIYQNSISKLGPRILISGKSEYLSEDETAQTIRALLLSGIRSAILWHRSGGSRLKLVLSRKAYVNAASQLIKY